MRRPIVAKESLDLQSNHFLRRSPGYPLGISLGEIDYLRGWRDDFLGQSLDVKYTQVVMGVGSNITLRHEVGGVVRMQSGGAATRYALLELGDGAGSYEPLDADYGWVQMGYLRLGSTADIYAGLYAYNSGGAELLVTGIRTDVVANNWIIRAHDGVAFAHTDTGVAADTDWHLHIQHVYTTDVPGYQIDYWLDGRKIGSQTVRVPTVLLAPGLISYTVAGAAVKNLYADIWNVIPRNLT